MNCIRWYKIFGIMWFITIALNCSQTKNNRASDVISKEHTNQNENKEDDKEKGDEKKPAQILNKNNNLNNSHTGDNRDQEKPDEILQTRKIDSRQWMAFFDNLEKNEVVHSKRQPPIFLFFIDTLRGDYLNVEHAPYMASFAEKNMNFPWTRSAATSTAHSSFGLFFSMIPQQRFFLANPTKWENITKKEIENESYLKGSPFLTVLKKIGYKLNVFGHKDIFYCDKNGINLSLEDPQDLYLKILFSKNPHGFLDECPSFKKEQSKDKTYLSGKVDNETIDTFIDFFKKDSFKIPSFSTIHLSGVHHPYGWVDSSSMEHEYIKSYPFKYLNPSYQHWFAGRKKDKEKINVMNSYANGVRSADYQFWRFAQFLKSEGVYDESIIVLVSDHGHALFDLNDPANKNVNGHGQEPFAPLIKNVIAIKWPSHYDSYSSAYKAYSDETPKEKNKVQASIMDIFPTIMDYLGVDLSIFKNLPISGTSLFTKKTNCEIIIKSDYDMWRNGIPPNYLSIFAFDNGTEKVFLSFSNKENIFKSKSIIGLRRLDENDKDLPMPSAYELYPYLSREFSDCVSKFFDKF